MTYQVTHILIEKLLYKILAPRFQNEPVKDYMNWINYMEKNLKLMETASTDREYNMLGVYNSIRKTGVIHKPLIIRDGPGAVWYYVIIGNQRLCSLRALDYTGLVPCVITPEEDGWGDDQPALNQEYTFDGRIHILQKQRDREYLIDQPGREFQI